MPTTGGPIQVLHVEDDADFADLTAEFLSRFDEEIVVDTVRDASVALARVSEKHYDCVVSDYDMPGMDGIEFLATLRESNPDLPFILFTGKGSEEVASNAISNGVTDYLQKSRAGNDQYKILIHRIQNAVDRYRSHTQSQRLLDAIQAAHEGISLLDENGEFIYVNKAYADLYGYEPEEILGEHWELLYPTNDIEMIYESVLPTVDDAGSWEGVTTGLRADGTTFIEDHIVAKTEDGGLVCTVRDITEEEEQQRKLQREQRRYRALFENTSDAIVYCEFDGDLPIICGVNAAFEQIFGYAPKQVIGQHIDDIVVPENDDNEAESLNRRIKAGEQIQTMVKRKTANGVRDFLLKSIPLVPGENGVGTFAIYVEESK